ncbi:hypothetical protein COOONC_20913 [Cooperia oncophora]
MHLQLFGRPCSVMTSNCRCKSSTKNIMALYGKLQEGENKNGKQYIQREQRTVMRTIIINNNNSKQYVFTI